MAVPVLRQAFATGEISPEIYGRVDLDRTQIGATTLRSLYVDYRGGAKSRAGTKFCGFSKQTGRDFPPRLMTFQFSINQGLILEFGNFYMRVLFDGAFVTENPLSIGGVTQANPAVVTFGSQGALSATVNNGGVTFPYAPGDLITLLGGTALTPAVLQVTSSQLLSILVNNPGIGYGIGNTITLAGGTSAPNAVATVASLVSVKATGSFAFAFNPSDGNTITLNGTVWTFKTISSGIDQTVISPSLGATLTQLVSDLNASADVNVSTATYSTDGTNLFITFKVAGVGGNGYTLVSGGAWAVRSGATLTGGSATGVGTVNITTAGIFSALPASYQMTQSATSGGGSGASFQTAIFGPHAVAISQPGAYSVVPANPVAQASSTGIGVGATFNVAWGAVSPFVNGDWIFISGVSGMTELNGNTYVVAGATPTTVELFDVYGDAVDSTGFSLYTGGGTAARVYTVPTIYAEEDLPYLKLTQSADVMTICCVNQKTGVEYPPQDLTRNSDTNWVFTESVVQTSIAAPASAAVSITSGGNSHFAYVVTAISPVDGSESIASNIARSGFADGLSTSNQALISWSPVAGVSEYNVYKAQPSFLSQVPDGALYGYLGSAYGTSFIDQGNIVQDYSQVPPLHRNPFARGQISGVSIVTGGSGYSNGATATIASGTGSGAVIQIITTAGNVSAAIITNAGSGYQAGDTITIHPVSGGSGATATLTIGAESGTYPSVPSYFQQRRVLGNSLNNTDTYWMSQPGAFLNFDSRIPTIDTDAIIGSPWSVQVNGIQWLVQTAGGLLVMTGLSAWLLVGAGSFATSVQPISPASQDNVPQAFTGVSPTLPPVKINYDVIYANSKNSFYYDLPYQLYALSEPIDLTEISTHLFTGFTMFSHAWCEQPSKLFWAVRDDGVLLSLTFYKSQAIAGWARHDTNGLFVSDASVVELPIDALYVATQRYPGAHTAYMIERMDDRLWSSVEDVWAVDCGLSLPQPTPAATLTVDLPAGLGSLTGVTSLVGGAGYSAGATAKVIDNNGQGPGSGAVVALTIVAGVITAVAFTSGGTGYTYPVLEVDDPSNGGSGFSATVTLNTAATFTAGSPIFSIGDIGDVIRMGGGVAVITAYNSPSSVTATIETPVTDLVPNSGGKAQPQVAGDWTQTTPVSVISGLDHLIGMTVTGLADGNPITPRAVQADGSITLDAPASAIVVGLAFLPQMQTTYLDTGQPTIQSSRKKVATASALLTASRGAQIGSNQVDGSTLSPMQIDPTWSGMQDVPDLVRAPYNGKTAPLYTGWTDAMPVQGGYTKGGQVCMQQPLPLPLNIDSVVASSLPGDTPSAAWASKQQQPQQQ